jgi:hypothetical protein
MYKFACAFGYFYYPVIIIPADVKAKSFANVASGYENITTYINRWLIKCYFAIVDKYANVVCSGVYFFYCYIIGIYVLHLVCIVPLDFTSYCLHNGTDLYQHAPVNQGWRLFKLHVASADHHAYVICGVKWRDLREQRETQQYHAPFFYHFMLPPF